MATPKRMPWVIPDYCEGCTACIAACPHQGLAMRTCRDDKEIPWLDDPNLCTGCGRCAEACGLGGIAMTEFVDEARQRFLTMPCARG